MGLEILDHVCLVKDHVVPRFAFEDMCISTGQCIRGDTHIELIFVVPPLAQLLPTFRIPVVTQNLETGEKLLELHFPV